MSLYHCGTRLVEEPDFCSTWGEWSPGCRCCPLQRGAGPGEGHLHVPGPRGLPVRLERVVEGERWRCGGRGAEPEPRGAAKGRPLQLEQQPDAPAQQWREGGVFVTCEASQGSQSPVSRTLSTLQCSQD
ncbi:hypothetical protein WMY93_019075 [Mugilogobius chulae]|uniref:Uncharacterized protein n=1 Tax=Mugilogobius chulae TaxID=88201 RepID=A0AAW0NHP7_9GOBI